MPWTFSDLVRATDKGEYEDFIPEEYFWQAYDQAEQEAMQEEAARLELPVVEEPTAPQAEHELPELDDVRSEQSVP